ncbi:hypothetical protein DUI87_07056 [Hirundo rustica rustica]|uniref:Uncharacterized protein n=1 Tax=Hirundo rustica rustica TaxID=333673 RepID=A0A3M0KNR9_HIRRU|nr:hypothetical protein DUI87_07056 [Hirundo rustica rustica]
MYKVLYLYFQLDYYEVTELATVLFGSSLYPFDIIAISAFSGFCLKDDILVFPANIAFCLVNIGLTFKE